MEKLLKTLHYFFKIVDAIMGILCRGTMALCVEVLVSMTFDYVHMPLSHTYAYILGAFIYFRYFDSKFLKHNPK